MLKIFREILKVCILVALIGVSEGFADEVEVKIKLISFSPARVSIEGKFLKGQSVGKEISFLRNIADVSGLGERIEEFSLFGLDGKPIEVKKLIGGEYQADESPTAWKSIIRVDTPAKLTDSTHISWLTETHGLLMLADLLPKFVTEPKATIFNVDFELPADFQILSTSPPFAEVVSMKGNLSAQLKNLPKFNVRDAENAVFLIGKNLRTKSFWINNEYGGRQFDFATVGEWKFTDEEAFGQIQTLIKEYHQTIGSLSNWKTNIILLPFPQENNNPERWRAETRGATVTIISGDLPFKSQAVQRLSEQLRHELFHLWMPNTLAFSGNYDWFYEGFSIYHALRTGVELGQIRFEDFLNTLSQAHRIEQMMSEANKNSLIEVSGKRWAGSSNFIYAKGLAVAFLCDIALLKQSKGKVGLKNIFRKIYNEHRIFQSAQPFNLNPVTDGNKAILSILKTYPELNVIIKNYIEGKSKIEWTNELNTVGIEQEKNDFGVQLKVLAKPNGRQKDLLDKLGYNQWRKIGQKTK